MKSKTKLIAISALAVLIIALIASIQIGGNTSIFGGSSPIQFQACINHSDGSQACNNSIQIIRNSIVDSSGAPVSSVQISNPTINNPFNIAPTSWSITGSASWSTGLNCPISASGSGMPPNSIPIAVPCSSVSASQLQNSFGSSYGSKNVTVTLGSFVISGTFAGVAPMTFKSPRTAYANFVLNYGATVSTSSQTSTTTTTTSQTTTVSGGTVTTGTSTSQWQTTATASTSGATGNSASNGVLVTLAPDNAIASQSIVWAFLPSSFSSQCQGGLQYNCAAFINLVTPTSSISVAYQIGSIPSQGQWISAVFSYALDASGKTPYIVNVLFAGSSSMNNPTSIFNQVVPVSAPVSGNTVPSPYTSQYQTWLTSVSPTSTTTTNSGCPFISPSKCAALSIISVQF